MATEPDVSFAHLLRQARQHAGLTQEALAELAGISPRAVSSLERGINRAPRRDTLELLCAALDLPPDVRSQWERARKRLALRVSPPSGTAPASPPENVHLPSPMTSFLGRERELADLQQTLTESRLVTITGPGGVGKTRLGTMLAEREQQHFVDGVFFVPLAALEHPELVDTAIIRALGLDESAERSPAEALSGYLRDRSLLLVLDNFEHVVAAAPLVSHLLEECSRLKALVTSRVPLHLSGEREYPLRSLTDDMSTALFLERSREVRPDFDPNKSQAAVITEICRRLDGLPLAIELAAARSRVLPPHSLLERLEHPLTLLAGGPRDVPQRQQTLRSTIAWSYDLLEPDDQALFRILAIFRDGWSLEAAEAVGPDEVDVLDGMTALVESSLIEAYEAPDGEPRFRMLETIREFGIEQLEASGSSDAVRDRHARYVADLVAEAPPCLRGPDHAAWLDRFDIEHANIQAALDWFLERDVEPGLRMVASLWHFWWMRCHLTIGRRYCDLLLERADDSTDPATLAAALTAAGVMTLYESDLEWDRSAALHEQALSIWLDLANPPEGAYWSYLGLGTVASRRRNLREAEAYFREVLRYSMRHNQPFGTLGGHLLLGNQLSAQGQLEAAKAHYQKSLALAQEFSDPWAIALNSMNLGGILVEQDQFEEGRPLIKEALALSRQLNHSRDIAWSLTIMGDLEIEQGRLPEAAALYDEALEFAQKSGETRTIGTVKLSLGELALKAGDFSEALDRFQQTLDVCRLAGSLPCIAGAIEGLAKANVQIGNSEQAVRLYASAMAFREQVGIPAPGVDRSALEHTYVTGQQALTREAFDEAWQAGCSLTPEDVLLS